MGSGRRSTSSPDSDSLRFRDSDSHRKRPHPSSEPGPAHENNAVPDVNEPHSSRRDRFDPRPDDRHRSSQDRKDRVRHRRNNDELGADDHSDHEERRHHRNREAAEDGEIGDGGGEERHGRHDSRRGEREADKDGNGEQSWPRSRKGERKGDNDGEEENHRHRSSKGYREADDNDYSRKGERNGDDDREEEYRQHRSSKGYKEAEDDDYRRPSSKGYRDAEDDDYRHQKWKNRKEERVLYDNDERYGNHGQKHRMEERDRDGDRTKRHRNDGERGQRHRNGGRERMDGDERRHHRNEGKERTENDERHLYRNGGRERTDDDKQQSRSRRGEREDDDDGKNRKRKNIESHSHRDQNANGSDSLKSNKDAKEEQSQAKENISVGDAKPQGRSGGVYIPPFKLAQMMKDIQDKSSVEYQRMTWDALRKSINGLVNKVNASNIKNIIPELISENLIRGRGLFARSCMKSQLASPAFTHVFAALVAVVNTKFPELGELLLKRIILQFRRALKRNDKPLLLAAAKFIAHLVNQQVAHEVVALEVLMVLLENPTDDSVEVAVGFVKECGAVLQDLAPQGLHGIFERFRGILHEGEIDKRVQFMIEGLFAIRKVNFQGHQAVLPELDLVEPEDQFTHEISLSEDLDPETNLDIFRADKDFLENEKKYESIKRDILGEEEDDGEESSSASDGSDESEEDDEEEEQKMQIKDETETNLVNLRRTIYLTIMSSVDFEEAGHKLLKIKLEPGQEMELNIMLLECCSQERTYLRYYGLLGQRFCMINKIYQENFDKCFVKQYSMIHRLETNKLRNVAKFFAHLLGTDALPWNVLGYIRLTEEDTTSSSRIFIKILFQELSEHLGLRKLNEKLNDPLMQDSFEGIFPKDNPKNTRFAINFFTSIGLGGITDGLREYLKNMPRLIMQQQRQVESESESSDELSSSESESESSESDSGSGSGSESESESESDSESEQERRKRRKR